MKFYSRENELQLLEKHYSQTDHSSTMTVITGRRRIGKTMLSLKFASEKKYLYLFVAKKNEHLLCEDLVNTIKSQFDVPVIGHISQFRDVFQLIMQIGKKEKIVVIIDEFQEFFTINKSVYSDIQNIWDREKNHSKVHLIFIGSVYSLMEKIFKHSKEPLFGRADQIMTLEAFSPSSLKKILQDYNEYCARNLLALFTVTGGVPRYVELLIKNNALEEQSLLDFFFSEESPFLDEGKHMLIEEFGREYGTYFSILELLSEGRTTRSDIESILEKDVGGYLDKLENVYYLISRRKPVNAKTTGRLQKLYIKDNFLNFWFRFVHKYRHFIESRNYGALKKTMARSLDTFYGFSLETLFKTIFRDSENYTLIGNYWEKGNRNEIDLVAVNELEKLLVIAEIKMNKNRINRKILEEKSHTLLNYYKNCTDIRYLFLGLEDVDDYLT